MRTVFRRLAAVAATVTLSATLSLVATGVADAAPAQCAHGANGFTDIPDDQDGQDAEDLPTGEGAYQSDMLMLQWGKINGVTMGWAHLMNTVGGLTSGDQVWMDWTTNNGATWLQCGPFTPTLWGSVTSAAKPTSAAAGYHFRAGANLSGRVYVTPWW